MTTPAIAADLVRGRLAARTQGDRLDSFILRELNAAQAQLEKGPFYPWFLHQYSQFPLDNKGSFVLPPTFVMLLEDYPVWWLKFATPFTSAGTSSTPLNYKDPSYGVTEYSILAKKPVDETQSKLSATGTPLYYSLARNRIQVAPYPQEAPGATNYDGVAMAFIAKLTPITSLVDAGNLWYTEAIECLVFRAASVLAKFYLRDRELGAELAEEFSGAFAQLKTRNVAMEAADFDLNAREVINRE